jgi:hypothetical protein
MDDRKNPSRLFFLIFSPATELIPTGDLSSLFLKIKQQFENIVIRYNFKTKILTKTK